MNRCQLTVLVSTLLSLPTEVVSAQCPDGRPPPCRRPAPPPVVDSNALVILPFEVTGPAADVEWLREGLVDLLSASLDGFAGWRVISPRTVVVRARQGADRRDLLQSTTLARSLGAGGMVLGSAVLVGSELRARADLYDVAHMRRLATIEARSPAANPGPLVDRLAVGLARHRLAGQRSSHTSLVREYATSSPEALRAYLAAEQLARRGSLQVAVDSLNAAIAHDSAFGLAYSRLMVVTAFGTIVNLPTRPETMLEPALRYVDRLPLRQRDILLASAALWQGRRSDALGLADGLGQRYPDDADAAYAAGEIYVHFGLTNGVAPTVALEPLERAIRLDPDLFDAYQHAIEVHCLIGDTASAWSLLDHALVATQGSIVFRSLQTAMRVALRGEDPVQLERALRGADGSSGLALLRAAIEVRRILEIDPARGVRLSDALTQLATAPEQPHSVRAQAWRVRTLLLAAQGRHREAWDAARTAASLEPASVPSLAFTTVFPLISGAHVEDGIAARTLLFTAPPAPATLVIVGWSALAHGDSTVYGRAVQALDSMTAGTVMRAFAERRLAGLRGLVALARGDSALAREQLELAHDASSFLGSFLESVPDAYFALRLARLERASGALDRAERRLFAMWLDNNGGLLFRAEAEELRGQMAGSRGDTASALRAFRNFVGLWSEADAELQPRVQAAREALARLER